MLSRQCTVSVDVYRQSIDYLWTQLHITFWLWKKFVSGYLYLWMRMQHDWIRMCHQYFSFFTIHFVHLFITQQSKQKNTRKKIPQEFLKLWSFPIIPPDEDSGIQNRWANLLYSGWRSSGIEHNTKVGITPEEFLILYFLHKK
jgi:hypothetical protein